MWNLKYGTDKPIYRTETDSQTWRTDLWLPWGRGGGRSGMYGEFGVGTCTLLYRMVSNEEFPCGAVEMSPTRNHEVVGLILGLAPWVKEPALP